MKWIKLTLLTNIILMMFALPAQACACGGTPWDFADWFNSQPYEYRSTANVIPPLGFAWSTDYRMVGMNLCGQTETCFEYPTV